MRAIRVVMRSKTPYEGLPRRSFWRTGVANCVSVGIEDLFRPKFSISQNTSTATAGSCFAQQIHRELKRSGCSVVDTEPPPPGMSDSVARRFGFNQFSARYGNIYTARHLRELIEEAYQGGVDKAIIWRRDERFFDALRPSVEPNGHASESHVMRHRTQHLDCVRKLIQTSELLIFTLGLTEAWIDCKTDRVLPSAPGVIAGDFDASDYRVINFDVSDVIKDVTAIRALLRDRNPEMKLLLTVSPVPMTATAGPDHVLVANTYTKSTLRAAAGRLAQLYPDVDYFPSFELIAASPWSRSLYTENRRAVAPEGIAAVMMAFGEAYRLTSEREEHVPRPITGSIDPVSSDADCEDALLNAFAP
jgi:GSCFA family